jgi:hypothetical protein
VAAAKAGHLARVRCRGGALRWLARAAPAASAHNNNVRSEGFAGRTSVSLFSPLPVHAPHVLQPSAPPS